MINRKLTFTVIVSIILLLIHLYAYRVWIFSGSLLTTGDWVLSLQEHSRDLLYFPLQWNNSSMGGVDATPFFYPFLLFEGLLSYLKVSYAYIERITFMWPIIVITPISSYLLVKQYVRNNISAVVGVVAYVYNTYFIIIQSGHLTLMMGFAMAPLVIYLFKKSLKADRVFYALATGFVLFLISFYEFRAFYLTVMILILYCIFDLILGRDEQNLPFLQRLAKIAINIAISIALPVLLNFYWIITLPLLKSDISQYTVGRTLFGSSFFTLTRSLALFHPFWTGGAYYPFIVQPLPLYFFSTPAIFLLGLWTSKKNPNIFFFGILSLIGIFLTKQSSPPFTDLYSWLFTHVPGFGFFREASKFYFLIAFGYFVLISFVADQIWRLKRLTHTTKQFILILIIALYVWNLRPLITGEIGTMFVPKKMDNDYLLANDFIMKQPEYFRTLWFPIYSRWSSYSNNHPKIGAVNSLDANWGFIKKSDDEDLSLTENIDQVLKSPFSDQLLDLSSVKYVFVPILDKQNDYDFFADYGDRGHFISELDSIPYLKPISIGTKNIKGYVNEGNRPHIYTTKQKETIRDNIPYKNVMFTSINQTQYTILVNNVSTPFYLNFSENYHSQWKIRVGDFKWYDAIFKPDYFVANTFHIKNDANLNSFYLDPDMICRSFSCKNNLDNSKNISITLYFSPQSYTNLGFIISLLCFISSILYFFVYTVLRLKRRAKIG